VVFNIVLDISYLLSELLLTSNYKTNGIIHWIRSLQPLLNFVVVVILVKSFKKKDL
jgi:hypothetical protein